ncbi:MAG: flagellar basal body-associated FliL family protein [Rhizobiaceae bacterium]|nr:flagellar basal body-associated FliL family protein [Rhizobiaceae bacterium]
MAAAAATADEGKVKKGPGLIIQLVVLLVLTAAAMGAGWFFGGMLGASAPTEAEAAAAAAAAAAHAKPDAHGAPEGHDGAPENLRVYPLETITTNLADPTEVWVRLELALVFTEQPDPELAETVHQDILAYMRTVKARQIERPSGFQHLRSDLDERARVRSDGKVKQVLIRTMLFE